VVLTSNEPWNDVVTEGPDGMPPGRFVTGVTHGVRVVGVCIPWADAHVSTGRKMPSAGASTCATSINLRR